MMNTNVCLVAALGLSAGPAATVTQSDTQTAPRVTEAVSPAETDTPASGWSEVVADEHSGYRVLDGYDFVAMYVPNDPEAFRSLTLYYDPSEDRFSVLAQWWAQPSAVWLTWESASAYSGVDFGAIATAYVPDQPDIEPEPADPVVLVDEDFATLDDWSVDGWYVGSGQADLGEHAFLDPIDTPFARPLRGVDTAKMVRTVAVSGMASVELSYQLIQLYPADAIGVSVMAFDFTHGEMLGEQSWAAVPLDESGATGWRLHEYELPEGSVFLRVTLTGVLNQGANIDAGLIKFRMVGKPSTE